MRYLIAAVFVLLATNIIGQEITTREMKVYKSGGWEAASWMDPADTCLCVSRISRVPVDVLWLASRTDSAVVVDYFFEGSGGFNAAFRIRLPATEANLWGVRYSDSSVTVRSRLDINNNGVLDISDFSAAAAGALSDWRVFQHFAVYWSRKVEYTLTLKGGGSMNN